MLKYRLAIDAVRFFCSIFTRINNHNYTHYLTGRYRNDSQKSECTFPYHDTFAHSHNYDKAVEIDRVDFGVDSAPKSVQNTHSAAPPKLIEQGKFEVVIFTLLASAKLIIGRVNWCQRNGCSQQRSAYTILGPEIS